MKNKKLLSVILVLVMICACTFGMLIPQGSAEGTEVTFEVADGASLADVLATVASHPFADGEFAKIALAGEHTATVDEDGILFGLKDLTVPVVFDGGTLVLEEGVSGDVICGTDLTFQNLTFGLAGADVDFYAGANAVVFDTVALGEGVAAEFFADVPAGEAAEASSLTFKATNYAGTVYAAGAQDGAELALSSVVVENSEVANVGIRKAGTSATVAKVSVTVTGADSKVEAILAPATAVGEDAEDYAFDVDVTVAGGVVATLHDGDGAGDVTNLTTTVSGGNVKTFYGTGAGNADEVAAYGNVTNSLTGGLIDLFYGTGIQAADGAVTVQNLKNDFLGTLFTAASGKTMGTGDAEIVDVTHYFADTDNYASPTNQGYFYGTLNDFDQGGDISGTLKHVINTNTKWFHSNYVLCTDISGKLDIEVNLDGDEVIGLSRMRSSSGSAASVEYDARNVGSFGGQCYLLRDLKIAGDVTVNLTDVKMGNSYMEVFYGMSVGGDVTVNMTRYTAVSGEKFSKVLSGVSHVKGNLAITLDDCTVSKSDHPFTCVSNSSVDGTITNTVKNCTFKGEFHGATNEDPTKYVTGNVTNNVSGGTFASYSGGVTVDGTVTNNVSGGAFTVFYGTGNFSAATEASTAIRVKNVISDGTFSDFYGTGHGVQVTTLETTISGGKFTAVTGAGQITGNLSYTLNITGGSLKNVYVARYSLGDANGYGTATLNMTGGEVTGALYGFYTDVLLKDGVPSTDNPTYSDKVVNYYANVEINVLGPVDVARDELLVGGKPNENAIVLGDLNGQTYTGVKAGGYIDLVRRYIKGDFTFNLKNVFVAGNANFISAAKSDGNLVVNAENVFVKNTIVDVQGTTTGKTSHYSGKVTGDITLNFKNLVSYYNFQWLNRSGCCNGDFTMTLDSCHFRQNGAKEMNVTGGDSNIYVCGDMKLEGRTSNDAAPALRFARQKACERNVYIGAKMIDGVLTPVETTFSGDPDSFIGNTYDTDTSKTAACIMHIYDVTMKDGVSITFGDRPNAAGLKNILYGNVTLMDGSTVMATEVAATAEEILVAVDDGFASSDAYVTVTNGADVAKLYGVASATDTYIAKKDTTAGTFSGGLVNDIAVSASMTISDRISVNMLLGKDGVDAFLASMVNADGEHALDYKIVLDLNNENSILGEGFVDATSLVDGYYKVTVGTVAASGFDQQITFSGFGFNASASILDITEAAISAAAGTYTDEELDLFKAIYNYGASVLGLELKTDFSDSFALTAGSKPAYQKVENDAVSFTGMNLLMGDAMGISINGVLASPAAVPTFTMKVKLGDGEAVETKQFNVIIGEDGKVSVTVFFSAEIADEDVVLQIFANGAPAIAVKTGLQDYTAYVQTMGDAELACAQLIQAALNYKA